MHCPNCGLANAEGAKFCANCGTPFGAAPPTPPPGYQPVNMPMPPAPSTTRDAFLKNLGIGCLIFVGLVIFFGLSCARSCIFGRRGRFRYRR